MAELAGTWLYRSFNPALEPEITPQEGALIWADGIVLTLRSVPAPMGLEGTIEWQGGGLDLNGTFENWGHYQSFDIVGTGRPGTNTAGWEYRYQGIKTPRWSQADGAVDQRPTVVGSVIRQKPHNGRERPAGYVGSFIAEKQPPENRQGPWTWSWDLTGAYTYRSFHNNTKPVYETVVGNLQAPPTANGLILQEAVFKLETVLERGITTLRGKIELPNGVVLNISQGQGLAGAQNVFEFVGTGNGWEYRYDGHPTRNWGKPLDANRVDQRPTLVGSVIIRNAPPPTPRGNVYPFIAVKQMTLASPAFREQNGDIRSKYTCDGEAGVKDVSPPLAWEGVPNDAKSLVLIMDDPDAPDPQAPQPPAWVHWVVYNIPPNTKGLPENAVRAGLLQGAKLGRNDWAIEDPQDPRAAGYGGPCPRIGRHRYFLKLYALDIMLDLTNATKSEIEQAMRGRVLANAELIGRYQKKG